MNRNDLILIRPVKREDSPFIYATWLRQLWYSKENTTTLAKETFFKLHHDRISKSLMNGNTSIACLRDDTDTILGYKVGDWIYVKKDWRGIGIEEALKYVAKEST